MHAFLAAVGSVLLVHGVWAAPFAGWFDDVQPDGTVVRIWGEGNEYSARFESEAGLSLVLNREAGRYEYADRDEATGALVGIGVFLGEEEENAERLASLRPHLRDTSEAHRAEAAARWRAKDEALGLSRRWEEVRAETARRRDLRARLASGEYDGPLPTAPTTGSMCGFTLLIDFPITNALGQVTNTIAGVSGEREAYGRDYMVGLLNGEDWHEDGNYSSVRSFYHEISNGKIAYTNVCTDWVLAPKTRDYYDNGTRDCGECGVELIADILRVMKNDSAYATKYLPLLRAATVENRTRGAVKAFNVLFAGGTATRWGQGLWAHSWSLDSSAYGRLTWKSPSGGTCWFEPYQITPLCDTLGNAPAIGTICHEDGHMICGFPDYYHYTDPLNEGVGEWSLMCTGNHLDNGRSPAGLDAYTRLQVGWADPIDVPSGYLGWLEVTNSIDCVYRFRNPANAGEYFLLENRQRTGCDRTLASGGIQIWRCREGQSNTSATQVPSGYYSGLGTYAVAATNRWSGELSLEQADGRYGLERGLLESEGFDYGWPRGSAGDVWYAENPATEDPLVAGSGYRGEWNGDTASCSRWYGGGASGVRLSHFSANGEIMRVFVGDPAAWDGPFASVLPAGSGLDSVTFAATAEAWGTDASSFDVYAETGSDEAFSTVLSSTKIGTMTDLGTPVNWTIADLAPGTNHHVRIRLENAAGDVPGPTASLHFLVDDDIAAAVGAPDVTFLHDAGNEFPWFVTNGESHGGGTSARSGAIGDSQTTTLHALLYGPGTLSFWWKPSTQGLYYDWIVFERSWNTSTSRIGGTNSGWKKVTVAVPAGPQSVSWTYDKNYSASGGEDCGWLDDVVWTPTRPPDPQYASPSLDGASPLGFGQDADGSATFLVTLRTTNADFWYTAYVAEALGGPYVADASSRGTGGTLTLTLDGGHPALFVRIGVSARPVAEGTNLEDAP